MEKIKEFIRAMVRPYLAYSSWTTILVLIILERPVPEFLKGVSSVLLGFYFLERALKHKNEGQ